MSKLLQPLSLFTLGGMACVDADYTLSSHSPDYGDDLYFAQIYDECRALTLENCPIDLETGQPIDECVENYELKIETSDKTILERAHRESGNHELTLGKVRQGHVPTIVHFHYEYGTMSFSDSSDKWQYRDVQIKIAFSDYPSLYDPNGVSQDEWMSCEAWMLTNLSEGVERPYHISNRSGGIESNDTVHIGRPADLENENIYVYGISHQTIDVYEIDKDLFYSNFQESSNRLVEFVKKVTSPADDKLVDGWTPKVTETKVIRFE